MLHLTKQQESKNEIRWESSSVTGITAKAVYRQNRNKFQPQLIKAEQKQIDDHSFKIRQPWNSKPYLLSLRIQQDQIKQNLLENDSNKITEILKRLSQEKVLSKNSINLIKEAYDKGYVTDIQNLVKFAQNSRNPIEESYSQKYIGLQDGTLGIQTSRVPIPQRLQKSQSVSRIEHQIRLKQAKQGNHVKRSSLTTIKQANPQQKSLESVQQQPEQIQDNEIIQNQEIGTIFKSEDRKIAEINQDIQEVYYENSQVQNIDTNFTDLDSILDTGRLTSSRESQNIQQQRNLDFYGMSDSQTPFQNVRIQRESSRQSFILQQRQSSDEKNKIFLDKNRLINSYAIPKILISQKKIKTFSESEKFYLEHPEQGQSDKRESVKKSLISFPNLIEINNSPYKRKGYLLLDQSKIKRQKDVAQRKQQQSLAIEQFQKNKNTQYNEADQQVQSTQSNMSSLRKNQRLIDRILKLDQEKKRYDDLLFQINGGQDSVDSYYTDQLLNSLKLNPISQRNSIQKLLDLKRSSSKQKIDHSTSFSQNNDKF
ncbi:UNKNOWN [Stylonychia lemnae]|uniref:Uncharacterized protein n=1 Tax=Stylonychia lemnae TaxID=5949 RepID=A0A077ZZ01_STYLE|nr:UNKNOWN [Stylonychia lemnae]|eukprot:CDW75145.1 UNKNOWN [Stylonychia lemnae]